MLRELFDIKIPPLIGIDISTTAVKLVELVEVGVGKYRLESYAIERLQKGVIVDGNIAKIDDVFAALKQAYTKLGSKAKNAAMGLPPSVVISKKLVLPENLPEDDLRLQAEMEANQIVPFGLDDVNYDYQVLRATSGQPGYEDVLLVASRKEKIDDRVAAAEDAGLKVLVMDTETNASQTTFESVVEGLLPDAKQREVVVLIDVGAAMKVFVFVEREQVYLREQPYGGDNLTQIIQKQYGMTYDAAEKLKQNVAQPENYAEDVLLPFLENLTAQIVRAVQTVTSTTDYTQVSAVLLTGGTSVLKGLAEAVELKTGIKTHLANPFSSMEISTKITSSRLEGDAPALWVACGLALRTFDTP